MLLMLCALYSCTEASAQNPAQKFWALNQNNYLLDQVKSTPASMGYSVRKLRLAYTGPAMKVRNATNNATADVSFSTSAVVDTGSIVKIISVGSSSFIVGATMSFKTFYGTASVFVETWYDQSGNARHVTQTSTPTQPRIVNAGVLEVSNTRASIMFIGSSSTTLQATVAATSVFGSGYIGTAASILEASTGTTSAFGYLSGVARWQCHINWSGNYYFQVGNSYAEILTSNSANVGLLRSYMAIASATAPRLQIFISGVSAVGTITGTPVTLPAGSTTFNIGGFAASGYHTGHQSELIIFPTALGATEINLVNQSQRVFYKTP